MGLHNSKRKKIVEVNNYYDQLKEFECCVCFIERKSKMKRIICSHQICEKCFYKINDICPICRQKLEPIQEKNIKEICYANKPYQKNYDINKIEIIEQLDLNNIKKDDVDLIKKYIGKLAVVGILIDKSIIVYFMPFFSGKRYEIISDINSDNKYLLYTLLDDLKEKDYDVWYDNKQICEQISEIIKSISI